MCQNISHESENSAVTHHHGGRSVLQPGDDLVVRGQASDLQGKLYVKQSVADPYYESGQESTSDKILEQTFQLNTVLIKY